MSMKKDPFRNPMKNARNLGSAKDGTHHWIAQRFTAVMLIPLCMWFISSLLSLTFYQNSVDVMKWFESPLHTLGMVLMLGSLFYHAMLGMQVVIEDYVHGKVSGPVMLITMKIIFITAGILSIMAVLVMHFGESVMVD